MEEFLKKDAIASYILNVSISLQYLGTTRLDHHLLNVAGISEEKESFTHHLPQLIVNNSCTVH